MEEETRMAAMAFEKEMREHAGEGLNIALRDIHKSGSDPREMCVLLANLDIDWDLSELAELPIRDRRLFVAAASIGLDMILVAMSTCARDAMGGGS